MWSGIWSVATTWIDLILNLIYETLWTGARSGLLISMLGKLTRFVSSNKTGSADVKIDGFVLEEKLSFKMLGLTFSSKLDWGFYIISIAKTTSNKYGALIRSIKFLSQYLYKSSIWPCMEYYCHVWAGAPGCSLELLDKLQKQICKLLVLRLLPLLNPWFTVEM